jgi:hypothetical protein
MDVLKGATGRGSHFTRLHPLPPHRRMHAPHHRGSDFSSPFIQKIDWLCQRFFADQPRQK